jgi:hypothetical protein
VAACCFSPAEQRNPCCAVHCRDAFETCAVLLRDSLLVQAATSQHLCNDADDIHHCRFNAHAARVCIRCQNRLPALQLTAAVLLCLLWRRSYCWQNNRTLLAKTTAAAITGHTTSVAPIADADDACLQGCAVLRSPLLLPLACCEGLRCPPC